MFKLLDTQKDIMAGVRSIKASGQRLDLRIWQVAASAVLHSVKHNECSTLDRLYFSMPAGSRRERLAAWIVDNSGITLYKGKADGRMFSVRADTEADTEALLNSPWYEHARDLDTEPKQWDFNAALQRVVKRAMKEAESGNGSVDSAALATLSKLLPQE